MDVCVYVCVCVYVYVCIVRYVVYVCVYVYVCMYIYIYVYVYVYVYICVTVYVCYVCICMCNCTCMLCICKVSSKDKMNIIGKLKKALIAMKTSNGEMQKEMNKQMDEAETKMADMKREHQLNSVMWHLSKQKIQADGTGEDSKEVSEKLSKLSAKIDKKIAAAATQLEEKSREEQEILKRTLEVCQKYYI